MKKYLTHTRAFTLVELLVVIAIIALLTAIIISNLASSRAKARDAKRVSDLGNIQLALELYFDRCKQYPNTISGDLTGIHNNCPTDSGGNPLVTLATYISQIPSTPSTGSADVYSYTVNNSGTPTNYLLHVPLESYNEALKNSTTEATRHSQYSFTDGVFNCYDPDTHPLDYCIGPK